MKECPNCGSVIADNEPYCENCGFDPGFDSGSWNHGSTRLGSVQYFPKQTENRETSDNAAFGCVFLIIMIFSFVFMLYVYFS